MLEKFKNYPFLIPVIVFSILAFIGANMHPLWGDEAETALFARNILQYGLPKGWDGVNIMGIDNATVLNKDLINHTSPWGQYYLTALSFLIFGESSFTARLPFILLSIFSIPILYFLALKISLSKRTAFVTVLILSLSVPFILFSYQARYYGLVIFSAALLLLSSLQLTQKSAWPKLLFVISAVLLFYGNYISFAVIYITTLVTFIIFKKFTKSFLVLSILIALFCLSWYLLMQPSEGRFTFQVLSFVQFLQKFLQEINNALLPYNINNGFPIIFLPVLLLVVVYRVIHKKEVTSLLIPMVISFLVFLILILSTVISYTNTFLDDMRYTMVAFPLLTMTVAMLIDYIWRWKKYLALLILTLLMLTNIFTLNKPRSFLWEFIQEAQNPYPSPDLEVAKYLKQHAKEGETVFINIDRSHEPLIFHLGKKVKFVNRILPNNTILADNADMIPEYIYRFYFEPDWVIMYGKHDSLSKNFYTFDLRTTFPLGLHPTVDLKNHYTEVILPNFFADMSRPEIHRRSFIKLDPSYNQQIFIYKKIK